MIFISNRTVILLLVALFLNGCATTVYEAPMRSRGMEVDDQDAYKLPPDFSGPPPCDCDRLAAHPYDKGKAATGVEWENLNPRLAESACREALRKYPDTPRFLYQYGRTLGKKRDYEKAVSYVQKAADMGYAQAEFALGDCYENGNGVDRNYGKALEYYEKSAAHGASSGAVRAAMMYERGIGVTQNFERALDYYRLSADYGDYDVRLGLMYEHGGGRPRNYQKAAQTYKKAVDRHDSKQAMRLLGVLYEKGLGVPEDTQKARELYQRAGGADYTEEPILQIETGMHTHRIDTVGADAKGRYLFSSSVDGTVRIWDGDSKELLRTLRVPSSKTFLSTYTTSAAMSPDGRYIAYARDNDRSWNGYFSIYIMDWKNNKVVRRLKGWYGTIRDLEFSKDGRFLAACNYLGLTVYRTSDYQMIAKDLDFGIEKGTSPEVWSADFDETGRLVVSGKDGYLRLYGPNFKLIAKQKLKNNQKPEDVQFSPDGALVAVLIDESHKIEIHSGKNLSYLYSPDSRTMDDSLECLTWANNGEHLYAGGRYNVDQKHRIRKWSAAGKGGHQEFDIAKNTILCLSFQSDDQILYGAWDGAFGAFDEDGKKIFEKEPLIYDHRWYDDNKGLLVSEHGGEIQFGEKRLNEIGRMEFSIPESALTINPWTGWSLGKPKTASRKIRLSNIRHNFKPLLNGKPIMLKWGERSRCAAIAPDENYFALGANWNLYLYDADGTLKWRKKLPTTWGVNISGDGKVVIAALGDGTIRWFRLEDGLELLSFFPHKDGKKWIAWTPSGYYTASPGGDDLIGWHINQGKDKLAEFYPASRFRSVYYRPDIVQKTLETLDEAKAIPQEEKQPGDPEPKPSIKEILPPAVVIASPANGDTVSTDEIDIRVVMKSKHPLKKIEVFVNGKPVLNPGERGIVRQKRKNKQEQTFRILLDPGENQLKVRAHTEYAFGEDRVTVQNKKTAPSNAMKPRLFMISVGVGRYPNLEETDTLAYTAADARELAAAFKKMEGRLFREVNVKLLADGEPMSPISDNIQDSLRFLRQAGQYDVAILFMAGHGVRDNRGDYFFLPSDAEKDETGLFRASRLIKWSDIKDALDIPANVIAFLDTCHAGALFQKSRLRAPDTNTLLRDLLEQGNTVFAASTGDEYSQESARWGHGAFTKAILDGLEKGRADLMKDNKISMKELDTYVSTEVPKMTGGAQHPVTYSPDGYRDFPLWMLE